MSPELKALYSRTNLTEADLQALLAERDACLARGDNLEYARCLLVQAHVVKWVRSDNGENPFERCHSLALEALEIFRRLDDVPGQISSLILAAPMSGREKAGEILATAMTLAEASGDEGQIARVLSRQAAQAGMIDREQAVVLQRRSLEIYERQGDVDGQAHCLFSLAILEADDAIKRQAALKSIGLFRSAGQLDQAARSATLALKYMEEDSDLDSQLKIAEAGLADAQQSGKRLLEGMLYGSLSKIYASKGDFEQADQYKKWETDITESDGLTDTERQKSQAAFAKTMAQIAKKMGNDTAAKMFRSKSRELRTSTSS